MGDVQARALVLTLVTDRASPVPWTLPWYTVHATGAEAEVVVAPPGVANHIVVAMIEIAATVANRMRRGPERRPGVSPVTPVGSDAFTLERLLALASVWSSGVGAGRRGRAPGSAVGAASD